MGQKASRWRVRKRRIFGPPALLFVAYSPLRGCSLLTPRRRAKSRAAPSALIYEMTSRSLRWNWGRDGIGSSVDWSSVERRASSGRDCAAKGRGKAARPAQAVSPTFGREAWSRLRLGRLVSICARECSPSQNMPLLRSLSSVFVGGATYRSHLINARSGV